MKTYNYIPKTDDFSGKRQTREVPGVHTKCMTGVSDSSQQPRKFSAEWYTQGFTIIELVTVIVLIGILAAVALPKFINLTSQAQTASASGVKGALASAVNMAHVQWIASASPATISLSSTTIVMSAQGWPESTTGSANGRATAAKCLRVWNGVMDDPPQAATGSCTGTCQYLVRGRATVCSFTDQQGNGTNVIQYDITTGDVTM